jgi:hypothetical protein
MAFRTHCIDHQENAFFDFSVENVDQFDGSLMAVADFIGLHEFGALFRA